MRKHVTPAADRAKKKTKTSTKKAGTKAGDLIPQPNGGAIYQGTPRRIVPGPGRPKDEVREKLLGIANGKGVDFLTDLMDGKVSVELVGVCPHCQEKSELSKAATTYLLDRISASVDQRIRGLDITLKYGVGTKEEQDASAEKVLALSKQWRSSVVDRAITELCPPQLAAQLLDRLDELTAEVAAQLRDGTLSTV